MVANGIVIPFGARTEEGMSEDSAIYTAQMPRVGEPLRVVDKLGMIYTHIKRVETGAHGQHFAVAEDLELASLGRLIGPLTWDGWLDNDHMRPTPCWTADIRQSTVGAPLPEPADHLPQLERAYRTALALEVLAERRTDRARDELEEAVAAQRCAHTQRVMAQRDYEDARDRSVGALVREFGADLGGGA